MRSSDREEGVGVFDALRAGFKRALDLRCDALTTPERLALLQSCEEIRRLLPAVEHPLINKLSQQTDQAEFGGRRAPALRTRLRRTRRGPPPHELALLAHPLTHCLNPDGDFTEHDRAHRRGLTIGRQDIDGMS